MYDELVKRLRELPHLLFVQLHGHEDVVYQAADAIEELSKYANTIMRLKSEGWYLQQAKHHYGYEAIATMPLPELPKEDT